MERCGVACERPWAVSLNQLPKWDLAKTGLCAGFGKFELATARRRASDAFLKKKRGLNGRPWQNKERSLKGGARVAYPYLFVSNPREMRTLASENNEASPAPSACCNTVDTRRASAPCIRLTSVPPRSHTPPRVASRENAVDVLPGQWVVGHKGCVR